MQELSSLKRQRCRGDKDKAKTGVAEERVSYSNIRNLIKYIQTRETKAKLSGASMYTTSVLLYGYKNKVTCTNQQKVIITIISLLLLLLAHYM